MRESALKSEPQAEHQSDGCTEVDRGVLFGALLERKCGNGCQQSSAALARSNRCKPSHQILASVPSKQHLDEDMCRVLESAAAFLWRDDIRTCRVTKGDTETAVAGRVDRVSCAEEVGQPCVGTGTWEEGRVRSCTTKWCSYPVPFVITGTDGSRHFGHSCRLSDKHSVVVFTQRLSIPVVLSCLARHFSVLKRASSAELWVGCLPVKRPRSARSSWEYVLSRALPLSSCPLDVCSSQSASSRPSYHSSEAAHRATVSLLDLKPSRDQALLSGFEPASTPYLWALGSTDVFASESMSGAGQDYGGKSAICTSPESCTECGSKEHKGARTACNSPGRIMQESYRSRVRPFSGNTFLTYRWHSNTGHRAATGITEGHDICFSQFRVESGAEVLCERNSVDNKPVSFGSHPLQLRGARGSKLSDSQTGKEALGVTFRMMMLDLHTAFSDRHACRCAPGELEGLEVANEAFKSSSFVGSVRGMDDAGAVGCINASPARWNACRANTDLERSGPRAFRSAPSSASPGEDESSEEGMFEAGCYNRRNRARLSSVRGGHLPYWSRSTVPSVAPATASEKDGDFDAILPFTSTEACSACGTLLPKGDLCRPGMYRSRDGDKKTDKSACAACTGTDWSALAWDSHEMVDALLLLQVIPPSSLLSILAALMHERRVALISSSVSLCSRAVLAVCCLLRPFEWPHILVPSLTRDMVPILSAPCPFFVGVKAEYLEEANATLPLDEIVCVYLDEHNPSCHPCGYVCTMQGDDPAKQVPRKIKSRFIRRVSHIRDLITPVGRSGTVLHSLSRFSSFASVLDVACDDENAIGSTTMSKWCTTHMRYDQEAETQCSAAMFGNAAPGTLGPASECQTAFHSGFVGPSSRAVCPSHTDALRTFLRDCHRGLDDPTLLLQFTMREFFASLIKQRSTLTSRLEFDGDEEPGDPVRLDGMRCPSARPLVAKDDMRMSLGLIGMAGRRRTTGGNRKEETSEFMRSFQLTQMFALWERNLEGEAVDFFVCDATAGDAAAAVRLFPRAPVRSARGRRAVKRSLSNDDGTTDVRSKNGSMTSKISSLHDCVRKDAPFSETEVSNSNDFGSKLGDFEMDHGLRRHPQRGKRDGFLARLRVSSGSKFLHLTAASGRLGGAKPSHGLASKRFSAHNLKHLDLHPAGFDSAIEIAVDPISCRHQATGDRKQNIIARMSVGKHGNAIHRRNFPPRDLPIEPDNFRHTRKSLPSFLDRLGNNRGGVNIPEEISFAAEGVSCKRLEQPVHDQDDNHGPESNSTSASPCPQGMYRYEDGEDDTIGTEFSNRNGSENDGYETRACDSSQGSIFSTLFSPRLRRRRPNSKYPPSVAINVLCGASKVGSAVEV